MVLLLLAAPLAGCLGAEDSGSGVPADSTRDLSNGSFATTPSVTARQDCYGEGIGGVPCFEASVAVDPQGRVFAAVSVCQKIARSTDSGATFEALDLPPLPPTAPPTTQAPGDCTLQIGPDGALWFSAFTFQDRLADPPGVEVPNHYGIQVARSDDGGESWPVNTWLAKASRHPVPAGHPDRQWLSFGEDDRLYLTFYDAYHDVDRAWMAVSEDAGASFGPFQPMPGDIPGDPIARGDGTLHVPYLDGRSDGYAVRLSTTTDGGDSFETTTIHDAVSGEKVWWPDIAQAPNGRLYATWTDGDRVLVARQSDDDGWSAPLVWNAGAPNATQAAPGIEIHDGVIDVVWFHQDGGTQSHVLGRAPLDAWDASRIETHVVATFNASRPVTHFADVAVTPDGHAVFAWTDPDRGMRLAQEIEPSLNGTAAGVTP